MVPETASAGAWQPGPRHLPPPVELRQRNAVSGSLALFLISVALMPLISLGGSRGSSPGILDRASLPDFVGGLAVLSSLAYWRLRAKQNLLLLFTAFSSVALLSLLIASHSTHLGSRDTLSLLAGFIILCYLLAYCQTGLAVVDSERALRLLCLAWTLGALFEGLVVLHDAAGVMGLGSVWFPDRMSLRIRGTFFKSGQLGQYCFMSAVVLFACAAQPGLGRRLRTAAYAACGAMVLGVIFASRRSAMLGLATWAVLLFHGGRRSLSRAGATASAIGMLVVALGFGAILVNPKMARFTTDRLMQARDSALDSEGFFQTQIRGGLETFAERPLLGWGIGHSGHARMLGSFRHAEIHCGPLAVLVETGFVGFVVYLLILRAIFVRAWHTACLARGGPYSAMATRLWYGLLAMVPFWVHNRNHRDRAFWTAAVVVFALSRVVRMGQRSQDQDVEMR